MSGEPERSEPRRTRWLDALRRAWMASGVIDDWVEDRGVTGVVWTPASYEIEDLAVVVEGLVEAGAKPDKTLLWDLAVEDIRGAAEALAPVYSATEAADGYVAVWLEPGRADNPDRAVKAAAEIVGEVRRANLAVAFAWTPSRAASLEALVAADCPVALSGVRDAATRDAVAASRTRGMERRRAELARLDEPREAEEVPVFLLGSQESGEHICPVALLAEMDLFGGDPSVDRASGRVPLSADAEAAAFNATLERFQQRAKRPGRDDSFAPETFARLVVAETAELDEDGVLEDVWARDHTIWKDDPAEIADRLGWLDVAERMQEELRDINEFARKTRSAGVRHVVICGMGGSVLAPQTFHSTVGGGVGLTVLDTTHPDHIEAVRSALDMESTLFVIASKSGTTVETRAHLEYFWSLLPRGDRFVAITDPGSELASLAKEREFLRLFENPVDIGGRFSALSYFGLVPAAITGVDVAALVAGARRAMIVNGPGVAATHAPGARLAAALSEAARKDSRDKLTLVLPPRLQAFGDWIEQLIAESTGKEGLGLLPVVGEQTGPLESYGPDRVFCVYSLADGAPPVDLAEEVDEEHPVIRLAMSDVKSIGYEMYRWEMATALLGYVLDINPFDQPDVESAKRAAREALGGAGRPDPGDLSAVPLVEGGLEPPRYIAIQAFLPPTDENAKRLEKARQALRDRHRVAVTVGFGPRYLHSTGQYHKGGPDTGVHVQVTGERSTDLDVPGMGFSFGQLIDAQADGDLAALRQAGRTAVRVSLAGLEETSGVA